MGDRAQITIRDHETGLAVYLYAHHLGEVIIDCLAEGITAANYRLDDPQKLAAYIFQAMTPPEPSPYGFAISASPFGGLNHPGLELITAPRNSEQETPGALVFVSNEAGEGHRYTPRQFVKAAAETALTPIDDPERNRWAAMSHYAEGTLLPL